MRFDTHLIVLRPISMLYSINHRISFSECMCIPLIVLGNGPVKCILPLIDRQRHYKHISTAVNTCNKRRIVEGMCVWDCLCFPLPLPGNNSVKTLPWQRIIAGGDVTYAVHVVSREIRLLVIPRTLCFLLSYWVLNMKHH
jgi:hypothetical protein